MQKLFVKWLVSVSLIFISLSAIHAGTSVADTPNLLINSDFESGDLSSWAINGKDEKFVLTQMEENVRTGNSALQISGSQNNTAKNGGFINQFFDVVPGVEYSLTFYAKGTANFTYRVTAAPPVVKSAVTKDIGSEWTKYTFNFTAPAETTSLRLDFLDLSPDEVAYVDDVDIHQLSSAKEMTAFGFSTLELDGTITGTDIAVDVPDGTDVTQLIANFTVSDDATVTVGDAEQTSGITANDFTNPVTYTITAEDGSTTAYTVTVTVLLPVNAIIAPTVAAFDKNRLLQTDVEITLTAYANTLDGIKNGATSLVEGTDYEKSGSQVTIKKQYLETLPNGVAELIFDMSPGGDPVLSVTVSETIVHAESLTISGPDTVSVPSVGEAVQTAQFQANVKDQFNQDMPTETVIWSLVTSAPGVTIDGTTGLLSLDSSAESGGSIFVQAIVDSNSAVTAEYEVFLIGSGTPYWPNGSKLVAGQIGEDFVVVTWPEAQDDQDIARYELYQVVHTTKTFVDVPYDYSTTDQVFTSKITGLTPGASYTFQVKAFDNEDNNTGAGLTVTLKTVMDGVPPVWPVSKSIVVVDAQESSVTLKWTQALDDHGIEGYVVIKDNIDVATVDANIDEYVLEGLTAGTSYQIRIEAIDPGRNRSTDGPSIVLTTPDNANVSVSTSYTVGSTENASTLTANQMLRADATVTNHKLTSQQVLVIVALYDVDGTMVNASYLTMLLVAGETKTLQAGFKLPSDIADHRAKTFIWDGTDPMSSNANPISAASIIPM